MFEETLFDEVLGPCKLTRSNRRTLGISVLPDCAVELVAPIGAELNEIASKLKRRRNWVERQKKEFASMNANRVPLRYVSGATHRYLGKQYRIRVSLSNFESVKLRGGYFHIVSPNTEASNLERLLDTWMSKKASLQFSRRIEKWHIWCASNQLPTPKIHLRKMRNRWGSAHQNGKIFLNPYLIRMPSICIDYVIAHEICHLKHPKHNSAFYDLLHRFFPEWKQVKLRLEKAEL